MILSIMGEKKKELPERLFVNIKPRGFVKKEMAIKWSETSQAPCEIFQLVTYYNNTNTKHFYV